MAQLIFLVIVAVVPLFLGLVVGGLVERRHFQSLQLREGQYRDMLQTQLKTFYGHVPGGPPPALVVAEVVIAADYLKSFLASLRRIFGGEVRGYQRMLERARRKAHLRLLEQARAQGYNALCNVRYVTADVGGNTAEKKVAMAAILASGTAYCAEPSTQ